MPPSSHPAKTIHQRNKSTSALSVATQGAKNTARRAFGDVSNTKEMTRFSRDDCAMVGKPEVQSSKAALAQPAQRPTSMTGIKGVLNNVTAKPINPAGKAQPLNGKRTTIYRDQLDPVDEIASKENTEPKPLQGTYEEWRRTYARAGEEHNIGLKKQDSAVKDQGAYAHVTGEQAQQIKEYLDRHHSTDSDTTISDTDEPKGTIQDELKKAGVGSFDPETEEWEDAEEDTHAAPVATSRSDNTTGGTTTVVYPKVTAITKREIFKAKKMVEASRTEEDIIEDFYDSSMVAEYSTEIFNHLYTKEVRIFHADTTTDEMTDNDIACHAPHRRLHDQPGRDPVVDAVRSHGLARAGALPLQPAPGDLVPLRQLH